MPNEHENIYLKPTFESFHIINDDLAVVKLQKVYKPPYVGLCILDLSKLHMYEFHYDAIKTEYGDRQVHFI